jgi:S-DNA-T family DNA segregation ATPase FtsK/SpoIIIE
VSPADRGLLVVGGPGSGVSNALDVIGAQSGRTVVRVPAESERMWDAVAALHEQLPPAGATVVVDDLDAVVLRFPPEYAQAILERIEAVVRRAGDAGILVVAGAHRMTGAVSRVGELFARRLVLPYPSRIDHSAAGGDPGFWDPSAPAGRGRLDGRAVQVALAPDRAHVLTGTLRRSEGSWMPGGRLTGVVARRSPAGRQALAAWEAGGAQVRAVDDYVADPASRADRLVIVGEPDDWQRHWRLLADVRGDHDLVVDTSCAAELRVIAGFRGVPPYCEPGRARAWLISAGAEPVRIVLPS